jgi:hypothetical protein
MENFKSSRQYYALRGIFTTQMLSSIENDENKIKFFYENILPSIATQVALHGEKSKKWICTLIECNQASFVHKNEYIEHVIETHGHDLPGDGEFLKANKMLEFYENEISCSALESLNELSNQTKDISLSDTGNSNISRSCSINSNLNESICNQDLSMVTHFGSFDNIKDHDVSLNNTLNETQLIRIEEQEEEDYWIEYFSNLENTLNQD